jgi:hypothetical protein
MAYYCHPLWFKIATKVKDEFGDEVIKLYLNYYRNYNYTLVDMITKQRSRLDIYYRDYIRHSLKASDIDWRKVITLETMTDPSLLKQKGKLVIYNGFESPQEYSNPQTSFYDFIFMVAFISFVYNEISYFGDRDSCSIMQEEIQAIIKEVFDEEYIDISITTPFANDEIMSILLKAYQGAGFRRPTPEGWTYYENQFKEYPDGLDVLEDMMNKFAPLWKLRQRPQLMNWKSLPF